MPFANFKFPQGLLNEKQKEEIIHKTTDMFAGYFGEGVRPYSMVLIDEVVDGGRGRKGFGWMRWSSEWLYDWMGLFNNYLLVRWSGAKVAPAR
jgi:4-oxalocrotonate tautomerase